MFFQTHYLIINSRYTKSLFLLQLLQSPELNQLNSEWRSWPYMFGWFFLHSHQHIQAGNYFFGRTLFLCSRRVPEKCKKEHWSCFGLNNKLQVVMGFFFSLSSIFICTHMCVNVKMMQWSEHCIFYCIQMFISPSRLYF